MPVLSNLINGIAQLPSAIGFGGATGDAAAGDAAVGAATGDGSAYEFREYYASACPHCQRLAGIWDNAAKTHSSSATSGNVKWTQIQCADENWDPVKDNEDACKHIMGFPTMKMFKDGQEIAEYDGARKEEALIDWVNEKAGIKAASMPMDLGLLFNGMSMFKTEEPKPKEPQTKNHFL